MTNMSGEVKKKIRPGIIELHPDESAIVVHYEAQEVVTQADGSQEVVSSKPSTKKITVKAINDKTNIPLLASEIVDKCKLIHQSKTGQVEDLLRDLLDRSSAPAPPPPAAKPQKADKPAAKAAPAAAAKAPSKKEVAAREHRAMRNSAEAQEEAEIRQRTQMQTSQIFKAQAKQYDPAYIEDLDNYIEDLYDEDMSKKVKATGMIASLMRNTENFEALLSHETLLQTLGRLLREDGKRSIDLCINIVSVFFSVSNFSQFHHLILDNQIGALTMDLIDLETKRTEHRAAEENISPAMVAQKALEASMGQVKLGEREKKLLALIQKQDRLLYICFYMLLNLAEDVGVEKKMKKKNIVVYLVKMLDRSNVELLILATTFLKKLSIYKENKEKMAECSIVSKLVKFVPVRNDVLLMSVLRLLHNLSFDSHMRDEMVKHGLIPKAVELMMTPRFQPVVLGLLYHISMEDKYKSMFSYTDAIGKMYDVLIRVQDLRQTPELIALAVNLTQNVRCAEMMCDGDRFDRMIRNAFAKCDELAFKVVRNLAQTESMNIKRRFGPYVEQMVQLLKVSANGAPDITAELFVEVLGTLSNMYIPEFDFLGLVRKHNLLNFLATYAQPGAVDDDILLEVVMFVGVLCNEGTAPLLVQSGLVNTLFLLMGEKKEDDEFVLQIAFTFHRFLMYEETRTTLLNNTQVVFYLVDLLQDKNKEVRRVADQCLDVIMDSEEEWAVRIRNLKFESFNQEWLDIVAHPPDQIGAQMMPGHRQLDDLDDGEVDYDGQEMMGYQIGDHRVAVDFDEFSAQPTSWGQGDIAYQDGGHYGNEEGGYDEEELMRQYQM